MSKEFLSSRKNDTAMSWCLKNNIKIFVEVVGAKQYKIVILNNGIEKKGTQIYDADKSEWYKKIKELYNHYYNHYKKKS